MCILKSVGVVTYLLDNMPTIFKNQLVLWPPSRWLLMFLILLSYVLFLSCPNCSISYIFSNQPGIPDLFLAFLLPSWHPYINCLLPDIFPVLTSLHLLSAAWQLSSYPDFPTLTVCCLTVVQPSVFPPLTVLCLTVFSTLSILFLRLNCPLPDIFLMTYPIH